VAIQAATTQAQPQQTLAFRLRLAQLARAPFQEFECRA
jgi:hypothetical protein